MAIPTLNGIDLIGCEGIIVDKQANIIPLTLPTEDSDATEVFDMLGVLKTITITGKVAKSTIAQTKAVIDSLEGIPTGDQATVNFVSDQTGTIEIMVQQVLSNWDIPGFSCSYTIKLIQGTQ